MGEHTDSSSNVMKSYKNGRYTRKEIKVTNYFFNEEEDERGREVGCYHKVSFGGDTSQETRSQISRTN